MPNQPPNWGRSQPALTTNGPGAQLARVELDEPRDLTVYLYGWTTPGGSTVRGIYEITHGSGGVSSTEIVQGVARGTVLHYCSKVLQVNSAPNQAAATDAIARAHIGIGTPQPWEVYRQMTFPAAGVGPVVSIPAWTTRVTVYGVTNFANPRVPLTDVILSLFSGTDLTFASPLNYRTTDLPDGQVPLEQNTGFLRFTGVAAQGHALVRFQGFQ